MALVSAEDQRSDDVTSYPETPGVAPAADLDRNVGPEAFGQPVEIFEADAEDEIELVIGITRGVGSSAPAAAVIEQLRNSFDNYGYKADLIKISKLIEDDLRDADKWDPDCRPDERSKLLIEHGNHLCQVVGRKDELVLRVIDVIRDRRGTQLSTRDLTTDVTNETNMPATPEPGVDVSKVTDANTNQDEESVEVVTGRSSAAASMSTTRRVWIIDSLKRVDEVTTLRNIYGDHFMLVGLHASKASRRSNLIASFEAHGTHTGAAAGKRAKELMRQDHSEPVPYGQDILRTLPLSDVFIGVDKANKALLETRRAVALLFGDPEATGPTRSEYAMQLASQTSTMSPELGLRVGALIISTEGDILASGTNMHPSDTVSPEYDAAAVDLQRMTRQMLERLSEKDLLSGGAKVKLAEDATAYTKTLFDGPLKGSDLQALTEYQRPVHAEMNALIAALRQQASLVDATAYVTDFPCHNCAKHLIAAGVRVVYLAPYAKSKALAMYGKQAKKFHPFAGVAPRRFASFFIDARTADRKDPTTGKRLHWDAATKREAMPKVTLQISMEAKEKREAVELGK